MSNLKPSTQRLSKALKKTKAFFMRSGRYNRKDVVAHHKNAIAGHAAGYHQNKGLSSSAAEVAGKKLHRKRLISSDLRKKYG